MVELNLLKNMIVIIMKSFDISYKLIHFTKAKDNDESFQKLLEILENNVLKSSRKNIKWQ